MDDRVSLADLTSGFLSEELILASWLGSGVVGSGDYGTYVSPLGILFKKKVLTFGELDVSTQFGRELLAVGDEIQNHGN